MLDMMLVQQCSPQVPPTTANAIVKTESRFDPFAIGVNKGGVKSQPKATNYSQAVANAKYYISEGKNIDMGLAQINSANLGWLGLTVEQVFDPCVNLMAMQTIYYDCFKRASKRATSTQNAIQRAFSCYNTGNFSYGFKNGYVKKVVNNHNGFEHLNQSFLAGNRAGIKPVKFQSPLAINQTHLAKYANNVPQPHISRKPSNIQPTNTVETANKILQMNGMQPQQPVIENQIGSTTETLSAKYESSVTEANAKVKEPKIYANWDIFKEF